MTPFYFCCYLGHLELVRVMLTEPKIDVTIPDSDDVIQLRFYKKFLIYYWFVLDDTVLCCLFYG